MCVFLSSNGAGMGRALPGTPPSFFAEQTGEQRPAERASAPLKTMQLPSVDKTPEQPPMRGVGSSESSAGIPPGCAPAPGYILTVFDGAAWLKQDGTVTRVWAERGVWPTEHEAAVALDQFFQPNIPHQPTRPAGPLSKGN